jgi:hypothetical protein
MYLAWTLATAILFGIPQDAPSSQDVQAKPAPVESTQPPSTKREKVAQQTPSTPAKRKPRKSKLHKHLPPPTVGPPRKIVIHQGSTPEPTAQLVPGMPQEQASYQRQETEQLLSTSDTNLQQLGSRVLNQNQQETVGQVRNYISGARAALKDGDTQRAHMLAFKAQLLSDDLLKH